MADRVAEIRARLAAATPGPWEVERVGEGVGVRHAVHRKIGDLYTHVATVLRNYNAIFIAAAPADLEWACGEIERLRDEGMRDEARAAKHLPEVQRKPRGLIAVGVHVSNKGCRNAYEGGGCQCPEGLCWVSYARAEHEAGEPALCSEVKADQRHIASAEGTIAGLRMRALLAEAERDEAIDDAHRKYGEKCAELREERLATLASAQDAADRAGQPGLSEGE